MIADKVKKYLEGTGIDIPQARMDTALELMRRSMNRNLGDNSGERTTRKVRLPRPSGTWACGREIVFKSLALEGEPYGWRSRLTFTHGDITEAFGVLLFRQALDWLEQTDVLVTPDEDGTQLNLDVMINPADWGVAGEPFRMKGSMDMTLRGHDGGEDVADWKALSVYGFNDLQAGAEDSSNGWWDKERSGYIAQVRWYMMMLRVSGRGKGERGYLVAVNKNTGHLAEALIKADTAAEVDLIRKAVYTQWMVEEAAERRAIVLQDRTDEGSGGSDLILAEWVRDNVPRARFTANMVKDRPGNNKRPDGTKGPCLELDTSKAADPEAFRCSYCDFTQHCWPDFSVVPMAKPVYRTCGDIQPDAIR